SARRLFPSRGHRSLRNCLPFFLRGKMGDRRSPLRLRVYFSERFYRSNVVKPARIITQDCRFVLLFQIRALEDFVNFLHAVPERNLVGKVGREHEWLRTDAFDGVRERLFITFAADENSTAGEILSRFFFEPETAVF